MKSQTVNTLIQLQKMDMPSKCLLLITLLSVSFLAVMSIAGSTSAVRTMFGLYGVFMYVITFIFFANFASREPGDMNNPSSGLLAIS